MHCPTIAARWSKSGNAAASKAKRGAVIEDWRRLHGHGQYLSQLRLVQLGSEAAGGVRTPTKKEN